MQKQFYRQIGTLVIPIVIQNLLSAAVNSADVVMLTMLDSRQFRQFPLPHSMRRPCLCFFTDWAQGQVFCARSIMEKGNGGRFGR